MYAVLYKFTVKPGNLSAFKSAWKALTLLIYTHEGSLGSRLHKVSDEVFVAYAQWPAERIFERAGNNLPEEAFAHRDSMRNSCRSIETLYKMEIIDDFLQDLIHTKI